jgi:hypothetical protein
MIRECQRYDLSFTINTHRRNILVKTGKAHTSDVIYDLKE